MNNFESPIMLQNRNQTIATKSQISLVSFFLKRSQRLQRHNIFQLMNGEKLQNTQN